MEQLRGGLPGLLQLGPITEAIGDAEIGPPLLHAQIFAGTPNA